MYEYTICLICIYIFRALTDPVGPEPLGAKARHRVDAVVQEYAHLCLIVPPGQWTLVQARPIGFIPGAMTRRVCPAVREQANKQH